MNLDIMSGRGSPRRGGYRDAASSVFTAVQAQLGLLSRFVGVRPFDRVEKVVQGKRPKDLLPLGCVIAVSWIRTAS
jgi:hypothetical protein